MKLNAAPSEYIKRINGEKERFMQRHARKGYYLLGRKVIRDLNEVCEEKNIKRAGNLLGVTVFGSYARGKITGSSNLNLVLMWDKGVSSEKAEELQRSIADKLTKKGYNPEPMSVTLADLEKIREKHEIHDHFGLIFSSAPVFNPRGVAEFRRALLEGREKDSLMQRHWEYLVKQEEETWHDSMRKAAQRIVGEVERKLTEGGVHAAESSEEHEKKIREWTKDVSEDLITLAQPKIEEHGLKETVAEELERQTDLISKLSHKHA